MKTPILYSFTLSLALVACGDDSKQTPTDAPQPTPDTSTPDAPPAYMPPTAVKVQIADAGPDQLQSVTAGPDGSFYAAGFFAETSAVGAPRILTVFKFLGVGQPDLTFSGDGFAEISEVDFKGGNDEIDITTDPDGKILVSATVAARVANPDVAGDRDIAVVRLLPTGVLDPSFSGDGVAFIDLSKGGFDAANRLLADASRGLTANASGVFVHAVSHALAASGGTPRLDNDFTVVKLTPAGEPDETFGDQNADAKGQFRLNFGEVDIAARAIHALSDGRLIAVGYAANPPSGNQPVIYKLTPAGKLDTTFNATDTKPGVFHTNILGTQTEVYNIAIHGSSFVTGGYGRDAANPNINDYISLRFNLETGVRDLTWGGAPQGVVIFDPSGTHLGSNCRGAFALPNNKTLLIGSTGPGNMPTQDAVFTVLTADGKFDTTYGTGINKYKLGTDGADQFWGAAVSGGKIAIVGYKGVGATQTDIANDDTYGLLFPAQ